MAKVNLRFETVIDRSVAAIEQAERIIHTIVVYQIFSLTIFTIVVSYALRLCVIAFALAYRLCDQ